MTKTNRYMNSVYTNAEKFCANFRFVYSGSFKHKVLELTLGSKFFLMGLF